MELRTWTQDRVKLALSWVLLAECKRKQSLIYSIFFMYSWESLYMKKAKLVDRTSVDQLHLTSLKQRSFDKPHIVATTQWYPSLGQAQLSLSKLVHSDGRQQEPNLWAQQLGLCGLTKGHQLLAPSCPHSGGMGTRTGKRENSWLEIRTV